MPRDPIAGPSPRWAADLWLALLAGPVAATVQLSVNYALVKWACANRGAWALVTLTVACALLASIGAVLAARHLRAAAGPEVPQQWSAESRRVLAVTAVALDALVVIFLLNTLIAIQVLSPCE